MKLSRITKIICVYVTALSMSHVPEVVFAETVTPSIPKMISATSVAEHLTRVQAQEKLDNFLKRTDVREQLMAYGLSAEEASKRMASLSELELRQLAGQVEEARAGGDILIAVLVVVLIIFLIKRI